ncbi:MAG: hypothetical protein ABIO67_12485 [Mycobacteriales bacterium]
MHEQRSWSRPVHAPARHTPLNDPEGTPSMNSPCTARNPRSTLTRTGAMAVVFGLAFLPTFSAFAANGPITVQAIMGGDGSVSSVSLLHGDGTAPAADKLPVTVGISQTADGDTSTMNYHVENTTVTTKSVSYQDAAGKTSTVDQEIAMPLVAQLSVRLPASRTDVSAVGARVTTLADGSSELVWSLVLFSPIGAPVSDVSFSSKGTGNPVARIDVAAVSPNATPGLAATAQAANATVNGNGILNTVATGASDGLLKLSAGVGQLLAGLDKLEAGAISLHQGLGAAGAGANQLADGSAAAKAGSGELATGLGKLAAGGGTAADGASKLSAGLAQISGGLAQLSAAQGLPAALDGSKRLQAGVDQIRAGLGDPKTDGTILNGLAQVGGGLTQVKGGLDGLATGLPAAKGGVDQVAAGLTAATAPGGPADQLSALLGVVRLGLAGCAAGPPAAAPATPCEALNTASFIVTHPAGALGATDRGGVKQQLQAAAAGLGQVSTGLGAATAGVGQLQAGVTALQAGVTKIDAGTKQVTAGLESGDPAKPGIAEGLDSLVTGLTAAVGGVGQLATGAKAASTGSVALADGTKKIAVGAGAAATGAKALDAGLGKIADGQRKVADGLPAAVAGSGQIADGLGAVVDGEGAVAKGLADVRTQAV